MADFRREIQTQTSKSKTALENHLRNLLPEESESAVRGSLNNEFKEACFHRIAPDLDSYEYVQQWQNYSDAWETKRGKSLATALRMLLTEQIGLPEYSVLDGYKIPVLAQIIVGIHAADNDVVRSADAHAPATLPPEIPLPLENPPTRSQSETTQFDDRTSLDDVAELVPHSVCGDEKYAVYVLDCTPPITDERQVLRKLRRDAWAKADAGYNLEPKEAAAQALNKGETVFYIGQTNDIFDRIERHRIGASAGSARFTNLFYPQGIVELSWHDTEDQAKSFEKQRAAELTVPGESYAYYN